MFAHLGKIQLKMQVARTPAAVQPYSSSSSSQCWEQHPGTHRGTQASSEKSYFFGCAAGLTPGSLRGGQISGVLSYVRGVAAPMAADLGLRGAGSPAGRGSFSSSGCWPASVLTTAAARVVLYSQFFKQAFCHSTEIITKRLNILVSSAIITCLFPTSQQGDQVGTCSICWGSISEFLMPPFSHLCKSASAYKQIQKVRMLRLCEAHWKSTQKNIFPKSPWWM